MKGIFNKTLSIALLMSVAGASAWQMPTFSMPKVSMPKVSTPAFVKTAGNSVLSLVANHPYVAGGVAAVVSGDITAHYVKDGKFSSYTPSHGVNVVGNVVKDVVVATPGYVTTKVVSNPKSSIATGSTVAIVGAGLGVQKYNNGVSRAFNASRSAVSSLASSVWSYAPNKETAYNFMQSRENDLRRFLDNNPGVGRLANKCLPDMETVVAENLRGKICYALLATAGLGAVAYKYSLGSKAVNLFKGKEDSLVTYWKQQIVEMKRISVALEGTDAIEVNMHYVLPRDKVSFNEAVQAFNDNQNEDTKAALKALVDGIIATAEMMLK